MKANTGKLAKVLLALPMGMLIHGAVFEPVVASACETCDCEEESACYCFSGGVWGACQASGGETCVAFDNTCS